MARRGAEALARRCAASAAMLEELIRARPEIESIPITAPVFVTGLPRSGTTALVTQLARQPGMRSLPYWEARDPFGSATVERKRWAAHRECREALQALPALASLNPLGPDVLADDHELQALAFGGFGLEWQTHVPDWRDRYLAEDQAPVYRYLKRAMQALSLRRPGRWIVKSPQHMEQIPAIKAVFPDATIIRAVRDHGDVLRSMRRVQEFDDRHSRIRPRPRDYWPARFEVMAERFERDRHLLPVIEVGLGESVNLQALLAPA
jgi:hypothetical protein